MHIHTEKHIFYKKKKRKKWRDSRNIQQLKQCVEYNSVENIKSYIIIITIFDVITKYGPLNRINK